MSVQAKVKVTGHNIRSWGPGPQNRCTEVVLNPVYGTGAENKSWSEATPSGELKLSITNQAAIDQLPLGAEFILAFERVPCASKDCDQLSGHDSPCGKRA